MPVPGLVVPLTPVELLVLLDELPALLDEMLVLVALPVVPLEEAPVAVPDPAIPAEVPAVLPAVCANAAGAAITATLNAVDASHFILRLLRCINSSKPTEVLLVHGVLIHGPSWFVARRPAG